MPLPTSYQQRIAEIVGTTHDPRHVEAFMRVQYGTLDHLSREQFNHEVYFVVACLEEIGPEEGEKVAKSYGL